MLFEIGVAVEAGAVVGDKLLAFLYGDAFFLHRLADPGFEAAYEPLRVVLHIFEHVGHGFAVDGLVDAVALGIHADMDGVGVAEEVVHVAQDFLVGTHEEHADVVVFALADGMEREVRSLLVVIDVGRDLAVAVAGDVLDGRRAGGFLREAFDGHDGEELVDAPRVGERLEDREVAEILVAHRLVEFAELVGHVLLVVDEFADFVGYAPVEA